MCQQICNTSGQQHELCLLVQPQQVLQELSTTAITCYHLPHLCQLACHNRHDCVRNAGDRMLLVAAHLDLNLLAFFDEPLDLRRTISRVLFKVDHMPVNSRTSDELAPRS